MTFGSARVSNRFWLSRASMAATRLISLRARRMLTALERLKVLAPSWLIGKPVPMALI
jgi:hypothetical protein